MKHFITNSTKAILLTSFFSIACMQLHAQVKIGSNPTTSAANTNLDVEATNGKRVQVNKADGTVIIQNQPSAALTDSIMMSTAATGQVKQMSVARLAANLTSTSSSGNCIVPDVADSYVAPPIVSTSTDAKYLDLSGMPIGKCFWNWPFGVYAVKFAIDATNLNASYIATSFCLDIPQTSKITSAFPFGVFVVDGSTSLSQTETQLIGSGGNLSNYSLDVGLGRPGIGFSQTASTYPVGIICRYK